MMTGNAISENANPHYPEISAKLSEVSIDNESDVIKKELQIYQQIKVDRANLIEQMKNAEGSDKTELQAEINELNQNMANRQEFVEAVSEKLQTPPGLVKKFSTAIEKLDQAKSDLPEDIVYTINYSEHELKIYTDSNNTELYSKVESIIGKGVSFSIQEIPNVSYLDCVNRYDCDPHVGGMAFNADGRTASISSPVNIGWFDNGYISAGHALLNTSVGDPVFHDGDQIGTIQQRIHDDYGACDCMYVDKTTSTWSYSNYYNSPTSSIDIPSAQQPSINQWVIVSGLETYDYGKIVEITPVVAGYDSLGQYIHTVNLYKVQYLAVENGDSGAPVVNFFTDEYAGLVSAGDGTYTWFVPWNTIKSGLSLPTNPFD